MCVIVKIDQDKYFDPKYIWAYCKDNPHGFGFMWWEAGRVKHSNSMGTPEEAEKLFQKFLDAKVQFAFHCRQASRGSKTVEMTHPVKVLDKEDGDPLDCYMMHNGTITGLSYGEKEASDTYDFAKFYLRPLLLKYPQLLEDTDFSDLLADLLGYNKLVLLDSNNHWLMINGDLGQDYKKGIWISNKSTPSKDWQPLVTMGYTNWSSSPKQLPAPFVSHYSPPDGNDKTPGYWDFTEDGRSYFRGLEVKDTDAENWGERNIDELVIELKEFTEDKFFDFVENCQYEALDCVYAIAQSDPEEWSVTVKQTKVELLMEAMSDPIQFADKLASMVLNYETS